jgi:hypothetical protein
VDYLDLQVGDLVAIQRTLVMKPDGHLDNVSCHRESMLLFVARKLRDDRDAEIAQSDGEDACMLVPGVYDVQYYFLTEHGLGWRYAENDDMRLLRREP